MGAIPAHVLQQIGAAAVLVAPRPQMNCLAELGSYGRYRNKIAEQLRRRLRLSCNDLPEPFVLKLPMWSPTANPPQQKEHDFPILLPHEFMAAMYPKYPVAFMNYVRGEEDAIPNFWASIKADDPRMFRHPVAEQPEFETNAIPLRLHGDGVPFGPRRWAFT